MKVGHFGTTLKVTKFLDLSDPLTMQIPTGLNTGNAQTKMTLITMVLLLETGPKFIPADDDTSITLARPTIGTDACCAF